MKKCLVVCLLLITGCAVTSYIIKPAIPAEASRQMEIYFCPRDNCTAVFLSFIRNASTVDCALFDLTIEELVQALNEKNARVVLDNSNRNKVNSQLLNKKYDNNEQLSHNKFCIFDNSVVWTGSFNPTKGAFYNNDNVVIIHSSYLAENYMQEFLELWNNRFGKGSGVINPIIKLNGKIVENYFCPEDGCTAHVLSVIKEAKHSINFMTFSFTDDRIGRLLIEKHSRGIAVRGIFERFQNSRWSEFDRLRSALVDVRWDNNPALMHHKVFVIDNSTVITGSFNPTKSAASRNDENILIIRDEPAAKSYLDEFELLWSETSIK